MSQAPGGALQTGGQELAGSATSGGGARYRRGLQYMGQNYQDWKYALFVSLFVSFHSDLESKTINY